MAIPLILDLHPPAWLTRPIGFGHKGERRERIGPWTLDLSRDAFTGEIRCSLSAPRMSFARAAVTFRFSPSTETYDAVYRIDGGQAFSWRLSAMALASHGVSLVSDNAENPSDGRVILPFAALVGGRTVWIRPSPKADPTRFAIADLATAVARARMAGCGDDFTGAAAQ